MNASRARAVAAAVCVIAAGAGACGRRPASPERLAAAKRAAAAAAADESALRVLKPPALKIEWKEPVLPPRITRGMMFPLAIEVRNAGNEVWPAANSSPAYAGGRYSVRISHRWCGDRGIECPGFLTRFNLTKPLPPGEWQTIQASITAPPEPGFHELQFDALQELVTWFSTHGGKRLLIRVRIE